MNEIFNKLFDTNKINLTNEQEDIIREVERGTSVLVNSVAGSGKTTTLSKTFSVIPHRFLSLAFNVKIRDDLAKIIPVNGTAQTLNGLGHRMWANELDKKIVPAGNKLYQLCKENCVPNNDVGAVIKLVNAAKMIGLTLDDDEHARCCILPETEDLWRSITDDTVTDDQIVYAREVLLSSIKTAFAGWLDFNDQIYMPVLYGYDTHEFKTVLIDESQDLSPLNHYLVEKVLKPGGQVVAVGDRNQSIYGFRGADTNSMDNLKQRFALKEMPMTYSFRCGHEIVKEAQKIVPRIKAWKENPIGEVINDFEFDVNKIGYGAAILARTNAEVVRVSMELLAAGFNVNILGREISKTLALVVKNICPNNVSIDIVLEKLEEWYRGEKRKAKFFKQEEKLSDVDDKVAAIIALSKDADDRDDLLENMKQVFKSKKEGITVSTLHRAKGLEWKYVYFLNPDFEGKYARGDSVKYQQERNLKYVGITRAIEKLYFVEY